MDKDRRDRVHLISFDLFLLKRLHGYQSSADNTADSVSFIYKW